MYGSRIRTRLCNMAKTFEEMMKNMVSGNDAAKKDVEGANGRFEFWKECPYRF